MGAGGDFGLGDAGLGPGVPVSLKSRFIIKIQVVVDYVSRTSPSTNHPVVRSGREGSRQGIADDRERNPETIARMQC
jgi:hypothetical protein